MDHDNPYRPPAASVAFEAGAPGAALRIGGWLIVMMLGLISMLAASLFMTYARGWWVLELGAHNSFASDNFQSNLIATLIFAALSGFYGFCLYLMARRSRRFPKRYIAACFATSLLFPLAYVLPHIGGADSFDVAANFAVLFAVAALWAAPWMRYLKVSHRARHTFLR